MRCLILLALAMTVSAAQVESAPSPWKGLWAVDAVVEIAGDLKLPRDAKAIAPVRRYYMRDPVVQTLGDRQFLVAKGVVIWQETVAVPLNSVVAMGQFINNQVLVQETRKDPNVAIQVIEKSDVVLDPTRK